MTRIFSKSCLRFQVPYVTSTLERQSTSMYMLLSHMKSSSQEREKGKTQVKTESIAKLNNFTFQWTKALYQNNLKHIAFFFTLFKGYKCHKQTSKVSNFTKLRSYAWQFYLCFLSSYEIWNLFSCAPVRNCLWYYYR